MINIVVKHPAFKGGGIAEEINVPAAVSLKNIIYKYTITPDSVNITGYHRIKNIKDSAAVPAVNPLLSMVGDYRVDDYHRPGGASLTDNTLVPIA